VLWVGDASANCVCLKASDGSVRSSAQAACSHAAGRYGRRVRRIARHLHDADRSLAPLATLIACFVVPTVALVSEHHMLVVDHDA
jgi:hypothetical protein